MRCRSRDTYACTLPRAPAGACPPHTNRISPATGTSRFACQARLANTARSRGAPTDTSPVSSHPTTGPSTPTTGRRPPTPSDGCGTSTTDGGTAPPPPVTVLGPSSLSPEPHQCRPQRRYQPHTAPVTPKGPRPPVPRG